MEKKKVLLVQPMNEFEEKDLDKEIEEIREFTDVPFAFAHLAVSDWDRDLSPWEAPPVYGDIPFGSEAADTLREILDVLIPEELGKTGLPDDAPVVLGGYSLAGLFALWSMLNTDRFSGIAAASPSVWFPGWMSYLSESLEESAYGEMPAVYLSLGDREPKAGKPVMRTVGENIEKTYGLVKDVCRNAALEWNPGNHFRDPDRRTARGFAWCLEHLEMNN